MCSLLLLLLIMSRSIWSHRSVKTNSSCSMSQMSWH